MDTIIYFSVIIILYFILYKVIDKSVIYTHKKNCKRVRIKVHTPEQMLTHYRKLSDFNEEYVPDEVFKKEHDNGENNHEWLRHFE